MEKEKEKKQNKIQRFLSSLIGFPMVVLVFIFANNIVMDITIAIIALICSYEYCNCFKKTEKANPTIWYLFLISVFLSFTSMLSNEALKEILIAIPPISILILSIEMIFSKGKKNIKDIMVTLFGIIYIPLMLIFISIIMARFDYGNILIWYTIIASWGSDIFAYLIGSRFGKHKFTKISPNKTIEGCIAGVVAAMIISAIYTIIINSVFNLNINLLIMEIIIVILALIGQIGDLLASSMKRYAGIKDFSELIPGHGGLLDRLDSVIFILPFAYILLGMLV